MDIVVVQGLFINSWKHHAELLAVQHDETRPGCELDIAVGASHPRGTAPRFDGKLVKIGSQLPFCKRVADVRDIQPHYRQTAPGLQLIHNVHDGWR